MDEQPGTHRRRRRKAGEPHDEPRERVPADDADSPAPGASRSTPRGRRHRDNGDPGERGLRDLVGAGRSQLGVSGALRGRDVDRPSEEDLTEAEQNLTVVRRHWTPPGG